MLAYSRADWNALARHREIARWADEGLIDGPAAEALLARFPQPFHSPNAFFRIGLFVFGLLCASAGLGLFFLAFGTFLNETGIGTLLLIYGAGCLVIAEALMHRGKPFFRAGLEEAACYAGVGCWVAGFLFLTLPHSRGHLQTWQAIPVSVLLGAAALRYADRLMAIFAFAALVWTAVDLGRGSGMAGIYLLPASIMALSALIAWGCASASRTRVLSPWDPIWSVLRLSALLLACAAGNYWVMREWGLAWILDGAGDSLPSAWAFYAYTFAVPACYLAWGLAKKDRLCLDAGLADVAAAVLTYKAYHDLIPVETGLCLVGIALLMAAWTCLKAFRPPRFGLSAEPRPRMTRGSLLDAEALAAWASFGGGAPAGKIPEGFQGGGGKFGGGGAEGGF